MLTQAEETSELPEPLPANGETPSDNGWDLRKGVASLDLVPREVGASTQPESYCTPGKPEALIHPFLKKILFIYF